MELQEHTFTPKINHEMPQTNPNVAVKGLGRHLELKELKKQQVEDSLLREAEVFGLNHKFAVNADERDIACPSTSPKF